MNNLSSTAEESRGGNNGGIASNTNVSRNTTGRKDVINVVVNNENEDDLDTLRKEYRNMQANRNAFAHESDRVSFPNHKRGCRHRFINHVLRETASSLNRSFIISISSYVPPFIDLPLLVLNLLHFITNNDDRSCGDNWRHSRNCVPRMKLSRPMLLGCKLVT